MGPMVRWSDTLSSSLSSSPKSSSTSPALSTTAAESDLGGTIVSNRIRQLRFEHGEMTQQQLGQRIGVTRQTLNAIELGKYSPSLEAAFRIAEIFAQPLK